MKTPDCRLHNVRQVDARETAGWRDKRRRGGRSSDTRLNNNKRDTCSVWPKREPCFNEKKQGKGVPDGEGKPKCSSWIMYSLIFHLLFAKHTASWRASEEKEREGQRSRHFFSWIKIIITWLSVIILSINSLHEPLASACCDHNSKVYIWWRKNDVKSSLASWVQKWIWREQTYLMGASQPNVHPTECRWFSLK